MFIQCVYVMFIIDNASIDTKRSEIDSMNQGQCSIAFFEHSEIPIALPQIHQFEAMEPIRHRVSANHKES